MSSGSSLFLLCLCTGCTGCAGSHLDLGLDLTLWSGSDFCWSGARHGHSTAPAAREGGMQGCFGKGGGHQTGDRRESSTPYVCGRHCRFQEVQKSNTVVASGLPKVEARYTTR